MRVIRHPHDCPDAARAAVVALGNFDGLHVGHQKVLAAVKAEAVACGAPAGLLSFYPHPSRVLRPHASVLQLLPVRQKLQMLQKMGMNVHFCVPFTQDLAVLSARAFVEEVLCAQLGVRHVFVGKDFAFGKQRSGNVAMLAAWSREFGYALTEIALHQEGGDVVSSTAIRQAIVAGDVHAAACLLGRPYALYGRVQRGAQRGQTLGFPTANIRMRPQAALPAKGVYVAEVVMEEAANTHPAVVNIGTRPTVHAGSEIWLEAHLLYGTHALYGKRLEVRLLEHVRTEQRFDSVEALQAQIQRDGEAAKRYFEQNRRQKKGETHHARA